MGSAGCWLGGATVMLAEVVSPVPPSLERTALVVLFCTPVAVPVTFTEKVHEASAASVAAERLTLLAPAAAEIVPPPQLPVNPLGVATTNPAGIASVNPTSVSEELAFGLDKWKESEAEPFNATLEVPNDFEIVGGRIVGDAEDPPDEPPPHAEQQRAPRMIRIEHHARDVRVGNFRLAPGHHTEGR